ncbi:MAG: hypothetical protein ACREH5_00705 [Candidatus Omnitrophota bacterium]
MKKGILAALSLAAFIGSSFGAFAMDEPDLEGPIVKIERMKSVITVKNVGENTKLKVKEKRVLVKQGWINNYKIHDYVQIRLMKDNYEAKMIEKTRPKQSGSER